MAPKRCHAKTQRALLRWLEDWGESKGEIGVGGCAPGTTGQNWLPVPDLSFVYFERLPEAMANEACPVAVDLAIEIMSPDQTFGAMAEKATGYLAAGVLQVWAVDPAAQTITVFAPDGLPMTYRCDRTLTNSRFPDLNVTPQTLFQKAAL